ncbi:unnamed protein product, partial [Closterium sp. NIES-54]
MASRVLVSGLPRSLPPLPPGPALTGVSCVEGRQRAAPHSSEFPPTEVPLQTLHMDVWGPARVRGQGHEHYFLLVVDDFLRYTSVFHLRRKGEVTEVLIDWIRIARLQLRVRFGSDFPVLRLHSDRGGEFSSDLLRAFCRAKGIRQTFTLPDSPQQNGIAERRIDMVMDVAHTSMIHAAAPHFLWPFVVQYATHQINLQPQVSIPETSPTLQWTGKVGDASAFRVWGSRAFIRDFSADKLSSRAVPCVFLGFPPDTPGWHFYHPTSRRVLSSQDVMFDESGPAPSGVSQVDAVEPVEVAVDSGAARGAEPAGAGSGGAEPESAEPGGAGPRGAMAAQELRRLTYLLTDLGEPPRSPPVLYVDNKAMLALCREHRLEHRTKHIALRYFLARELQQRGQLRLAYVAAQANTADIFTKALQPCDHQRFCTMLAMASPTVLTFDAEGRAVDFDVWVDDLQLFLQCESRDGVSLFDHTSSVSTAPAATADSTVRSLWTTRDTVARLGVRSHLPPAEPRHCSPAIAALSRLMLPYLFPDLATFATVADLITHLRTSDARYRAALPT